jgi:malate dehydrogenase
MKKVAIIGVGFVGGTTAMRVSESGLAQVVLLDVVENVAKAKALDLQDARYSIGAKTRILGSGDWRLLADSDIVVVTAGLPRKPGMTREDLLTKNSKIVADACQHIIRFSPKAIVIVVSNPLDVLTYSVYKKLNFPRNRVFGMGVNLDTARFANLISEKTNINARFIRALVLGSHGETMLPMPRLTLVQRKPLTKILSESEIEDLVNRTKQRGAEIVSLYGSGSAYFGPSAAIFEIVQTILSGRSKEIPVSACLEGEYGLKDLAIGVPARIGKNGIEKIIEIKLEPNEKKLFEESAEAIKDSIRLLRI